MGASGIKGQRVIVTAGASGIGRAIADLLIANGARVYICDIVDVYLDDFAKAHPDAGAIKADVSSEEDVAHLFAEAKAHLGGLDALINNAGIAGPTQPVEDISLADWRRCLDIGLTGQFLCTRLAVPMLKEAGGGSIVNMSSVAIQPGVVEGARIESVISARAEQTGKSVQEVEEGLLAHVSLRRMVTAQDVAEMTLFLMSDAARNISGQSIAVDGNVETL